MSKMFWFYSISSFSVKKALKMFFSGCDHDGLNSDSNLTKFKHKQLLLSGGFLFSMLQNELHVRYFMFFKPSFVKTMNSFIDPDLSLCP